MRLLRLICLWAMAIILVGIPALSAFQAEQAIGTATHAGKKAATALKEAAQKTGEAAKAGANAVDKEGMRMTGKSTPQTPKARTPKTTGSAERAMPPISESEIASARASGKVWVNTETGVYHKGGRWYGTTRQGKFMTEDEAIRSGYKASRAK